MTDRDTLAAAALTGLLANEGEGPSLSNTCAYAYRIADAMLRERERTNHDAAPAATARTDADRDRTDNAAARPGEGTGDIPCPRAREIAAWAVYVNGEYDSSYGPDSIDEALEIAAECSGEVVPLYRTPQSHATPGEGSVQSESTVGPAPAECSRSERGSARPSADSVGGAGPASQEPVAWAILHLEHQFVSLLREVAEARNVFDAPLVPLYRSPTLTDEEREAVLTAADLLIGSKPGAILRNLLARLA
jgi:hypothetical protein